MYTIKHYKTHIYTHIHTLQNPYTPTYTPTHYLLTPWCRVLLEKLTVLQLGKKFPAFHGTRWFITALTSVRHLSTHTLENPYIHTPTHYNTNTYTHPYITEPIYTHTHTLPFLPTSTSQFLGLGTI